MKQSNSLHIITCRFKSAWGRECGKMADDSGFCEKHKNIKCVSCSEQATHLCSEQSWFVCGAPLCDNCEHTIMDNGHCCGGNLPEGLGEHCKKSEQVYEPWYYKKYK